MSSAHSQGLPAKPKVVRPGRLAESYDWVCSDGVTGWLRLLQPTVLIDELLEPLHVLGLHPSVLSPPAVPRRLAEPRDGPSPPRPDAPRPTPVGAIRKAS